MHNHLTTNRLNKLRAPHSAARKQCKQLIAKY